MNGKAKKTENVYLMEAANGMLVRVPESRIEAFQNEQREANASTITSSLRERLSDRIMRDIYGDRR